MTLSKAQNNLDECLAKPKLVVGLIVDQMRWDYLTRYTDLYTEGGFKRLMREGYNCNRTFINYIPAITAVGHSSVYTGSVPAINGIVGNDFVLNGERVYCTTDKSVSGVGTLDKDGNPNPDVWAGQNSPRNLLVTTIGDQLRLATNFRSKVIGVALKDRASIFPAGHSANAAYWMDGYSMNFITSTYYMKKLPKWVTEFNNRHLGEQYMQNLAAHNPDIKDGPWKLLLDESKYVQSAPRNQKWEDNLDGSVKMSPWGQTITIDMAMAAVEGENLGNNPENVPDLLAVSISSTDLIGHRLSPNSIWIEDTYLRLDREIERFLNFLDEKVGKGQYVLFLTADHGGSHNVQFRKDHSLPADVWTPSVLKEEIDNHLKKQFPQFSKFVEYIMNQQVFFTKNVKESGQLDEVKAATADYLSSLDEVAYAFPMEAVPDFVPEPIRTMAVNGYCKDRCGDVLMVVESRMVEESVTKEEFRRSGHMHRGTTHSIWNPRDTHIPLIFMGWHVQPAWDNTPHRIVDIAPTIAALLNIQEPSGCVGKSIF
jgi:predicted AlkP superfamily pyrophosphatase or phosphodiesterase